MEAIAPTVARQRCRVVVRGIVQGVGFRPFVSRLARELDLDGWVRNDGAGVTIEAVGDAEAIAALLKRMEDERERLAVILAGYDDPMGKLLDSNPGLRSRFSTILQFPSYTPQELAEIFRRMMGKYDDHLSPAAEAALLDVTTQMTASAGPTFGNAREVRNLFEDAIRSHAGRAAAPWSWRVADHWTWRGADPWCIRVPGRVAGIAPATVSSPHLASYKHI